MVNTALQNFQLLQYSIDDLFTNQKRFEYFIQPCQFFEILMRPQANFSMTIPPGQTGDAINIKIADGNRLFEETINLQNSVQDKFEYQLTDFKKVVPRILKSMSKVEARLNAVLCKQMIDTSKKYYLVFYNKALQMVPVLGGNYSMCYVRSPQMGLPFDLIIKDKIPKDEITLTVTYKLICK